MNEQLLQCRIASSASSGPRPLAKALAVSLCVHAALIGAFWHVVTHRPQPAARALQVELAPAPRPTTAVASVSATAAATPEPVQPTRKASPPARRTSVQAALQSPTAPLPEPGVPAAGPAQAANATNAVSAAAAAQAQQGALPIDLRVVDWLARYSNYPLAARRARIEGVVQLRVTLLPDGRLIDARIERSSGHALLDQAALDLLAHAARLPEDFGSARSAQIELQLPIVYRMRASST